MQNLFDKNTYTEEYYQIIDNAIIRVPQTVTRREAKKILAYTEKHHIIPRSLGGTDEITNLVWLTAAEHLKVHLLLVKMVTQKTQLRKMNSAAVRMANPQSRTQKRIIDAELIEELANIRIECAKLHSEYMKEKHKGENNPMFGKHHSDSSKSAKRVAMTGFKRSAENKKNCSLSKVGDKNPGAQIVTCPQCGVTGKAGGMRKHHFDHCTDHFVYTFIHTAGTSFTGTRREFVEKYLNGISVGRIGNLIYNKQQSVKGWMLVNS